MIATFLFIRTFLVTYETLDYKNTYKSVCTYSFERSLNDGKLLFFKLNY